MEAQKEPSEQSWKIIFTESHFEGEAWESRMYNGIAGCRILIFCQSLKHEDLNPVGPPVKLSENP